MEQFQFRSKARIVAIVDLVLTSMSIWIPMAFLFVAYGMTAMSSDPELKEKINEALAKNPEFAEEGQPAPDAGAFVAVFWFLFVLSAIVVIVQLVAAVKLVNATQLGKDAVGAAKQARFWRNCTIVFTVILLLGSLKPSSVGGAVFTWGCLILRSLGIYIVHNFIQELDAGVAAGILPTHHGQVPMNTGMAYAYIPQQASQQAPPEYNDVVKQ